MRLYYYMVIPFNLKNAGAMYQRLVNQMFTQQIGKTMEVYANDMLVKSLCAKNHLNDLTKMFDVLRVYKMKLNLNKCAFGVSSNKFLGFMVNQWGIKAKLDKIRVVLKMEALQMVKEVQRLTRRIIVFNYFVSKVTNKCLPIFGILRKAYKFKWTLKCEKAIYIVKGIFESATFPL